MKNNTFTGFSSMYLGTLVQDLASSVIYSIDDAGKSISKIEFFENGTSEILSSIPTDKSFTDCAVVDDIVFCTDYGTAGMYVYDFSDNSNPKLLTKFQTSLTDTVYSIAIKDTYAYMALGSNNIMSVDITNPAQPVQVGLITDVNATLSLSIKVFGNYLYGASASDDTVIVYDISDPANIVIVGSIDDSTIMGSIDSIIVHDNLCYYVDLAGDDTINILDISDPLNITLLSTFAEDTVTKLPKMIRLYEDGTGGKYILSANGNSDNLTIHDVTNPNSPAFVKAMLPTGVTGKVAKSITIIGKYAYVGGDDFIVMLDLSNIADPAVLGLIDTISSSDFLTYDRDPVIVGGETEFIVPPPYSGDPLVTDESYVYTLGDGNLAITDISTDATNPVIIGSTSTFFDVTPVNTGLRVFGNFVFASTNTSDRLFIYDITDPTDPYLCSGLRGTAVDSTRGIAIYDNIVCATHILGMSFIDVSNPVNPVKVAEFYDATITSGLSNVVVEGTTLYCFGSSDDALVLLDVSDVANGNVVLLGSVELSTTAGSLPAVEVSNGYVYIINDTSGRLLVIDTVDKANPVEAYNYENEALFYGDCFMRIYGDILVVINRDKATMSIWDITDRIAPTNISVMTDTSKLNTAKDFTLVGSILAVTHGTYDRIDNYDVTNMYNPVLVGSINDATLYDGASAISSLTESGAYSGTQTMTLPSYPLNTLAETTIVQDNVMFMCYVSDLESIDITDPLNPVHLGNLAIAGVEYMCVDDTYAYIVTATNDDLVIVDISDPTNMVQLSLYTDPTTTETATSLVVKGNFVFLTGYTDGVLTVINVANKAAPVLETVFSDPSFAGPTDIQIIGNFAYITTALSDSVVIVDITNPSTPSVIGSITDSRLQACLTIVVDGNYIYTASDSQDNVVTIDATDKANMVIVDTTTVNLFHSDSITGIYLHGGFLFVTSTIADAMAIYDVSGGIPAIVSIIYDVELNAVDRGFVKGRYGYFGSAVIDFYDITRPKVVAELPFRGEHIVRKNDPRYIS